MPSWPSRSASRRAFLAGAASSVIAAGSLAWSGRSYASDQSLADRMKLLYSNQFHFDDRGQPQISVGLLQNVSTVTLDAKGGLLVLPSGAGGTTVAGGKRFAIELVRGKPAKQRWSIVLEELVGATGRTIDQAVERWRERGHDPSDHELGTVFGVAGRVLDNRRIAIVSGDFSSESEALRQAEIARQRHGALGKLHPLVGQRSSGAMLATDGESGLRITAEGVLWFAAADGGPITVFEVPHDGAAGSKTHGKREAREYRGSVYVAIDRHGKLSVANVVGESDLLAGLVPAEIFASAPMAALEAQALAARGQLVAKIGTRHLDDPFLLCAEQHCQVYAGRMREHERTTKAVRSTAGWVAMRPTGMQLVDTVYSANSGGHSEDNDVVWPSAPDPQLRGRPDPLLAERFAKGIDDDNLEEFLRARPKTHSRPEAESTNDAYRWRAELDPETLAHTPGVGEALGVVKSIDVLSRGKSGRATRIRVVGKHGAVEVAGELRIRRALGGLKSSMFVVLPERESGRIVLLGGGHGHGVGLCQHGAMGMARAGKTYKEILGHYYAGAKLVRLW
jgi:stage II sporulation protein D